MSATLIKCPDCGKSYLDDGRAHRCLGLIGIVKLIDSYIDGGAVKRDNAMYVTGLISERDHADNGSGSTLHPLTSVHYTDGASPHFTIQAGWLQTLCLRHMGLINDDGLQIMAGAALTAKKKSEVKAAQDQAYGGKTIQAIDNLHFYAAGGSVATTGLTLGGAMDRVRDALGHMEGVGRAILRKDDAFLAGHVGYETYRLKELEAPAWGRLSALLQNVADSSRSFVQRGTAARNATGRMLLDVLVRARGSK